MSEKQSKKMRKTRQRLVEQRWISFHDYASKRSFAERWRIAWMILTGRR